MAISGGEIVGLLGDNGAGKTTLMRVMLGLMHAELGYVSVLGLNPAQNRHKLLKQCGAVIDGQRELPPRWTPLDLL
ncbi:ATP-binding cassette domain-containing protein, partial [Acinetobacter baumannii]